jgi:enolase-phosphatase E1
VAAPFSLAAAGIEVVLLDIEGTTTPISFVHERLFPYARARAERFLEQHIGSDEEIQRIVSELRELEAAGSEQPPASRTPGGAEIVPFIHWLIDHDRKLGPLKALQGRIWQDGYVSGELKGDVYADVPRAFARWTSAGVRVAIFSSGSVLAQELLFANSIAGDLSPFISAYFDTRVGAKGDAASYRRIVETMQLPSPSKMLFISDVAGELDAARAAGVQTLLCVRSPADAPMPVVHSVLTSFDTIS